MPDIPTIKFWNTDTSPTTDLQLDLGRSAARWSRLYALNASLGGIDYTWPTSQTANYFLKVSGSVLSWADPSPSFVTMNKWSTDT